MAFQNHWIQRFYNTSLRTFCLLLSGFIFFGPLSLNATARTKGLKPNKAYTFYLTDDRICKKCAWRLIHSQAIELTNKQGVRSTYRSSEILGVNNHPVLRWLSRKHAEGIGLPGRIIMPHAFDHEKYIDHP